jgi:outer membrane protein assembly factor BamB
MSGSPLVYDKVVVVNPGAQRDEAKGRALVAYDRETGDEVWTSGDKIAGYSSPMLATLGGRRQIVLFDGEGIGGYDAADGKPLWWHEWTTNQRINVSQPVVLDGDRVFVSSGYGVGCAMLQVSEDAGRWSAKELWRNKAMQCKFTSPVLYQGHLYGLDDGWLACVDAADGKQKWRAGRPGHYGHGQLLLSGDLLVILSESGELALVEATPERFRELGKFQALSDEKTWNNPALAGGKVFVRNHHEMACYDLTAK